MDNIEQYIQELIDDGYINENGTPLKCQFCDSVEIEAKFYYEESIMVEKIVHCQKCKEEIGHWNYGTWSI